MNLTEEEKKEIIEKVKEHYKKQIEDITFDRVVKDSQERLQKHAEEISAELTTKLRDLFPL